MRISLYDWCIENNKKEVLKMWDSKKNNISFKEISRGSGKVVWWCCDKGHSWAKSPYQLLRSKGCPYCNKERVSENYNFKILYPNLAEWWDHEKNYPLRPENFSPGSGKIVYWKCEKNHEWQSSICSLVETSYCSYCKKTLLSNEYNLVVLYPHVLEFWDYDKNTVLPQNVSPCSQKLYWWRCDNGHSWKEPSDTLKKKTKCPYCSGQRISENYNLKVVYPVIAEEWDYEKNYPLRPEQLFPASGKVFWWKCKNGHSFRAKVNSRKYIKGCPCCNNERVSGNYNFGILNKELLKEWDYERNEYLPEQYHPKSSKKVWWRCSFNPNHTWQTAIGNRTRGTGCPICKKEMKTSFPEQAIFYYIKKVYPDSKSRYIIFGKEADVYVPNINLAIEYDGIYRHNSAKKINADNEKEKFLIDNHVNFIRIKEVETLEEIIRINNHILCKFKTGYIYLNEVIEEVFRYIKDNYDKNIDIIHPDIEKDFIEISKQYISMIKENSIASISPKLLEEWDYEKNGNITPDMINHGSASKFWWKCKNGHEWMASALHRCRGSSCPYCSGKKIPYNNCLEKVNPILSRMWHNEKNGNLTPKDVSVDSKKNIWWKCDKDHEWQSYVSTMNKYNNCPYCNKRKITEDNNFGVLNKELLKEWDFKKNKVSPYEISKASSIRVWWICEKGHQWQARISNRSVLKRKCPYCYGKKANELNNLEVLFPDIINEWNYGKNKLITPKQITPYSSRTVWWKCSKNHEWQAAVHNRVKGYSCPYCKNLRATRDNNLYTQRPELIEQWHTTKNNDITPFNITSRYSKPIWWICENGHEWKRLLRKIVNDNKCPVCKKANIKI